MATHTNLMFGFPVRTKYPFTTVVDGSVHHGMVQDWRDLVAVENGLMVVPEPTQEQLFGSADSEEDTVGEVERERIEQEREDYVVAVNALIEQMGCSLCAAGSQDYEPDFFVSALCPRPESDPKHSAFKPLPELVVAQEVLDRVRRFCDVVGIPYEEPKWYLVDFYSLD